MSLDELKRRFELLDELGKHDLLEVYGAVDEEHLFDLWDFTFHLMSFENE